MKENTNKGFTLLEVVVVLAIMVIVLGLSATGFSMLNKTRTKSAAKTIESKMDQLRHSSMSRDGEWWSEIEYKDSKYYITVKHNETIETKVGDVVTVNVNEINDTYEELGLGMTLYFKDGEGAEKDITQSGLIIKFDRKSGAITSITDKAGTDLRAADSKVGHIIVRDNGGEKEYKVVLYYKTGQIDCQ